MPRPFYTSEAVAWWIAYWALELASLVQFPARVKPLSFATLSLALDCGIR